MFNMKNPDDEERKLRKPPSMIRRKDPHREEDIDDCPACRVDMDSDCDGDNHPTIEDRSGTVPRARLILYACIAAVAAILIFLLM